MGTFRLNAKNAGKVAPRVATKIVPVAKTRMGKRQHHDIIKKKTSRILIGSTLKSISYPVSSCCLRAWLH